MIYIHNVLRITCVKSRKLICRQTRSKKVCMWSVGAIIRNEKSSEKTLAVIQHHHLDKLVAQLFSIS